MTIETPSVPEVRASGNPGADPATFDCSGPWRLGAAAALERRLDALETVRAREVIVRADGMTALDTTGAWLLHRTVKRLEAAGHGVRVTGLRPQFDALLALVAKRAADPCLPRPGLHGAFARVGRRTWEAWVAGTRLLAFLGEGSWVLARMAAMPKRIRWRTVLYNVQTAGLEALPITGLLSFLLGIVIAYQGAEQLARFGANIYIADLVGLSMVRELSPLITAIIVAGRSGSAYTAQIGTMKVTEEIDALRTIGVPPFELLVLPKALALVVALPLLTVYTDVMGLLGGMLMAKAQLGVSFPTFLDRLEQAVTVTSLLVGIGKAPVFAVVIALVGCHRGFLVTGSAQSVGRETTVSVVQSIFLVILVDAAFSIAFSTLGI